MAATVRNRQEGSRHWRTELMRCFKCATPRFNVAGCDPFILLRAKQWLIVPSDLAPGGGSWFLWVGSVLPVDNPTKRAGLGRSAPSAQQKFATRLRQFAD